MPNRAPVTDYASGLRSVVNKDFLKSTKYGSQQWRAIRQGADDDLLDFERLLIRRMKKHGVPMFASEMIRTSHQQMLNVEKGVSKAPPTRAPHVHGFAVDIIHSILGWDLPKPVWTLIGHIGKEAAASAGIPIEWGGDWSFYDPAHWEIADWETRMQTRKP